MIQFHTADISSISKPGAMLITAAENTIFSPTWELVSQYKYDGLSQADFTLLFHGQMQESYKKNNHWSEFLHKEYAILICYCTKGFCHRFLVAEYLRACGAKYLGEFLGNYKSSFKL